MEEQLLKIELALNCFDAQPYKCWQVIFQALSGTETQWIPTRIPKLLKTNLFHRAAAQSFIMIGAFFTVIEIGKVFRLLHQEDPLRFIEPIHVGSQA